MDLVSNAKRPKWTMVGYEDGYVEIAELAFQNGAYRPAAFKPLEHGALGQLSQLANPKGMQALRGATTPDLIYYDPRPGALKVFWHQPRCRKTIMHQDGDIEIALPALVYGFKNNTLYVYDANDKAPDVEDDAFKGRPSLLPNIMASGSMCYGTVKKRPIAGMTFRAAQAHANELLWSSTWTHSIDRRFLRPKAPAVRNQAKPFNSLI